MNSSSAKPKPVIVFGVLALVLALRVMHLSSTLQSPLSYQPGPDEDYYQRFGAAVASGVGADSPEFTFMDPGYGYLLGAVFKLVGVNPFAVYLLQALMDTGTAYGILLLGRLLERPRAGLYGALLYAVTSTAIMFCATLLKETWVAAYMTWWVVGALVVSRSNRGRSWVLFGVYGGLGIALRSTLMLLVPVALLLPGLEGRIARRRTSPQRTSGWISKAALFVIGLTLSLSPWSLRNYYACGSLSPLPHNGGIVLHQVYNAGNPQSAMWIPSFVNYSNPSEIWRGYAAEASTRSGRALTPPEVDAYWRGEAAAFMREHPGQILGDVAHKSLLFLAETEVPNNRSSAEERLFSPLLNLLPPPMAWLLAMGLAGLVWFAIQDRRWPLLAAPIVMAWFTVAVFWAEDRFRFHAVPVLALCSGIWIDGVAQRMRSVACGVRRWQAPAALGSLAVLIGATSWILGRHFPPSEVRWDHIVWGYIKMGKTPEARNLAERVAREQPDNAPVFEALGYLAATSQRFDDAAQAYQKAIALRPRSYLGHYNLAKAYLALGRNADALNEARVAMGLKPSADTQALLNQIQARPGESR